MSVRIRGRRGIAGCLGPVVASLLLALPPVAHAQQLTAEQWRADLHHLAAELERVHVDPFHTVSPDSFHAAVARIDGAIPDLASHEVVVALARLVTLIGDGHTRLWLTPDEQNGFRQLPIYLYLFGDTLAVVAVDARFPEVAGGRVMRIGDVPAREALRRALEVAHRDNEMTARSVAPRYLSVPEVLHALRITSSPDRATYEIADPTGVVHTIELLAVEAARLPSLGNRPVDPAIERSEVPLVSARARGNGADPLWLRAPDRVFWYEYLSDSRTLFVQLNAISNARDTSMREFFAEVFGLADSVAVDRFVLDLRFNGGGNNMLNQPIVHGVIRRDHLNRRGKLFVIIGRHTFSAASHLVSKLELHTEAIFVGEPTGASPNHFGDAPWIILPHSRLRPSASGMFWQNTLPEPFEQRDWTPPQIAAPPALGALVANRDPAMEAILAFADQPDLSGKLSGVLESGSLATALGAYDTWKRNPQNRWADAQPHLARVGRRLLRAERAADALALLELNTREHPESADAWDTLGDAYRSLDREAAARAAYLRALELSPRLIGPRIGLWILDGSP